MTTIVERERILVEAARRYLRGEITYAEETAIRRAQRAGVRETMRLDGEHLVEWDGNPCWCRETARERVR